MSVKNHPNLHVVLFAMDILLAYNNALRGVATKQNAPNIANLIMEFVEKVEDIVNKEMERK